MVKKKTIKSKKRSAKKSTIEKRRVKNIMTSKSASVKGKKTTIKKGVNRSKKIAAAKKAPKVKGYGKRDLDHFRKVIEARRDEIVEQLQNLRDQMLDPTTGEYINENSPYSLHMAEQGTDAMEREKTFLYAQRETKFLGYLEDALKRIDAGTYGLCIECIDEPQHLCKTCPLIPKERLEAVPHSQLCLPIKQKREKNKG